ncbi:MAG: 50S ribosomal protein L23 [Verrucomicrobia bacterium]|nr:50S ribosomal protein L23 [Verrucomicrobiota bacterium]
MTKNPYSIIKCRYVTEKAEVLSRLETSTSNPCVARCKTPKKVFLVDFRAGKREIAAAVEEIYSDKRVKVTKVNTVTVHPKKCRIRGRKGAKAGYKKAIVSFEAGDQIEDV